MYVPPAPFVCTSMVVAALLALENTGMSGVLKPNVSAWNQFTVVSRIVGSAGNPRRRLLKSIPVMPMVSPRVSVSPPRIA